ncbi:MAG TPA: UDP-N-acetylglucosamine 1-carboxyvinyltransferase [Candidatus Binataceae bacterium]|nr:UDP-N-acetylglucosamine 1-carboxyvinyltransferase [Candidatus Binataceae bacterium]
MDKMVIHGGPSLRGTVSLSGSKNAALPIMMAAVLTPEPVIIHNVPRLRDVRTAMQLLAGLGVKARWIGEHSVELHAAELTSHEAPYDLVKTMRASFVVLGPLVARMGRARVSTPGGCAIGTRPVNLHMSGIRALGARIQMRNGYVEAHADRLKGARVWLDFPSVGATENIIMAAVRAPGLTQIENAAREPEVQDLAAILCTMGARITGAGTHVISIEGVERLHGAEHHVIPDRIEAGSLIIAAAITGGDLIIDGAPVSQLDAVIAKLRETGVKITVDANYAPTNGHAQSSKAAAHASLRITRSEPLRPVELRTLPYPGFPTDLQAQMMALLTQAAGTSVITETIFENRFMHALELLRMGADISMKGATAVVRGHSHLSGAPVMATDLRASMSLILAGLVADNSTEVSRVYHLDRGYEALDEKLRALGARIERMPE